MISADLLNVLGKEVDLAYPAGVEKATDSAWAPASKTWEPPAGLWYSAEAPAGE